MATNPTYPPIELHPNNSKEKKTVTVTCIDSYTFHYAGNSQPCDKQDVFFEELQNSGLFKEVILSPLVEDTNLIGPKQNDAKSDLYLEIYSYKGIETLHGNTYWAMAHVFTLGLLPLRVSNDFSYSFTFYNETSETIDGNSVRNDSAVWYWSPLIFLNGFNIIDPKGNLTNDAHRNAIRHYLKELQSKGLI